MFEINQKELKLKFRKLVTQPLPFFKGANHKNSGQVLIYPQIRCAYNRIKKSANSSTLMFLADALEKNGYFTKLQGATTTGYDGYKEFSIRAGTSLSKYWSPLDMIMLQSYYWFTIVRNPYSRVLSAYLQIGQEKERGLPNFIDYPGLSELSPKGFRRFICFLRDEGLYKNKHWFPQTDLLFIPPSSFDFIGRTETLSKDLSYILSTLGLSINNQNSLSLPHKIESSAGWKVTNATNKIYDFYDKKTIEIVYELYQVDFRNFKYSPDICRLSSS